MTAENAAVDHALLIPYLKNVSIELPAIAYVALTALVIVGASNGVNLTDGLDGLAIMPAVLVATALGVFAYAAGNVIYSNYLGIPYVAGSGELLVFCAALAGAGLGFLWFNTYPAQVFMGRWRCGKNWCCSSWAGFSSSKPSQSSSRLPPTR